jgi:hypothetical protein
MNKFKVGDRVRVVKDEVYNWFRKGQEGIVKGIGEHYILVTFDNGREAPVLLDEIELIEEPESKPFPTEDEFITWVQNLNGNWMLHNIYNYFAKFQYEKTVEVFPEVGKEYEFSSNKESWYKFKLESYHSPTAKWRYIRPIQPNRLEQLKVKHPNLTNDELIELLDILLTQMRE